MLELRINGVQRPIRSALQTPLLAVLRDEVGLTGPKFGCGLGQCGACTVHLDGAAVRSCVTPLAAVGARAVTTIEGLGGAAGTHPVQRAFVAEQAAQCGYCTPGQIMSAAALLQRTPKPSDEQIRGAMRGNLCRCATYPRILRAIKRASGETA